MTTAPLDVTLSCEDDSLLISPSHLQFRGTVLSSEVYVCLLRRPSSPTLLIQHRIAAQETVTLPCYFLEQQAVRLYSAGSNEKYQLGASASLSDFVETHRSPQTAARSVRLSCVPMQVGEEDIEWTGVAGGEYHAIACSLDGRAFSWGGGDQGQLGHPSKAITAERDRIVSGCSSPTPEPMTPSFALPLPTQLVGLQQVVQVACGLYHSIVLTKESKVWTFGQGSNGRLGHDSTATLPQPTLVSALLPYDITKV